MLYAMRHGYSKLMDKVERTALEVSQTLAFECFTPQVYNAWVSHRIAVRAYGLLTLSNTVRWYLQTRYYAQWLDLLDSFRKHCTRQIQEHAHNAHQLSYLLFFVSGVDKPASLLNWKRIFDDSASARFMNIGQTQSYNGRRYVTVIVNEEVAPIMCPTCQNKIQAWADGEMETTVCQMRKLRSFL